MMVARRNYHFLASVQSITAFYCFVKAVSQVAPKCKYFTKAQKYAQMPSPTAIFAAYVA